MKTKNIIIIISFIIVSSCLATLILINDDKKFSLDEEFYGKSSMKEVYSNSLQMYMNNKSSFALFIFDTSNEEYLNFFNIVNDFINDKQISIYKTTYYNIENIRLDDTISDSLSVAIFNKGKLVSSFKYEHKDNIKEEFYNWFSEYVELRDEKKETTTTITTKIPTTTTTTSNLKNIKFNLTNVKKENGKVNIYFFWGDGCPHCKKANDFFDSIEDEYKKLFNLYDFETWKIKENKNIMKVFSYEIDNKEATGVPYIVIGNKSYRGFSLSLEDDIKKTIKEQAKSGSDIYFDVIKDKYKG